MIQERYRSDYPGEFVILKTEFKDGKKIQSREWVPNPVTNQHISARAAVILGPVKSLRYNERHLERHRGGHLGKIKLQTYGNEESWRNLRLDFGFINDLNELDEILKCEYQEKTAIYTNSVNCIKRPEEFYLLPYNPKINSMAGILYLAAFDEHEEVFVCGMDNYGSGNYPLEKVIKAVSDVFRKYSKTRFKFVLEKSTAIVDEWRMFKNVSIISHAEFVYYCDL